MPQPATQSSNVPPLPPGYALDSSPEVMPPLPAGYRLDAEGPTVSARKGGALSWLEDLQGDIKYGTGATLPGRILGKEGVNIGSFHIPGLGARGLYSGVPESVGDFVGGPAIGLVNVAHGAGSMLDPSSTLKQRVRGFNEAVRGAAQTATPALAVTAPEVLPQIVPSAAVYGTAQQGIERGAEALGVGPDTAEAIGNAATLGLPITKAGMPRAGRFIERNAGPIGKAIGYGTGIYETLHTGNPLWLLTGSPRATRLASQVARGGGRAMQSVGETPMLPHELVGTPAPIVDEMPRQILEGEYIDSPRPRLRQLLDIPEARQTYTGPGTTIDTGLPPGAYRQPGRLINEVRALREAVPVQPRGYPESWDDTAITQRLRERMTQEGDALEEQERREWFERNAPQTTKGDLLRKVRESVLGEPDYWQ